MNESDILQKIEAPLKRGLKAQLLKLARSGGMRGDAMVLFYPNLGQRKTPRPKSMDDYCFPDATEQAICQDQLVEYIENWQLKDEDPVTAKTEKHSIPDIAIEEKEVPKDLEVPEEWCRPAKQWRSIAQNLQNMELAVFGNEKPPWRWMDSYGIARKTIDHFIKNGFMNRIENRKTYIIFDRYFLHKNRKKNNPSTTRSAMFSCKKKPGDDKILERITII